MKALLEYVRSVVVAVCLAYVVQLTLVKAYRFGGSTERLIYDIVEGDHCLVLRIAYVVGTPRRGQLVLTDSPESNFDIVSRVVGLPGEYLEIANGEVRINGAPLKEDYVLTQLPYNYSVQVPEGEYFLMADSRADGAALGATSLTWGTIPAREISGRAWVRYWPPSRLGFFTPPEY